MLERLQQNGVSWGHCHQQGIPLHGPAGAANRTGSCGCIVSGDTTPHSKPHPEPLLEAATAFASRATGMLVRRRRCARHSGRTRGRHANRCRRLGLLRPCGTGLVGSRRLAARSNAFARPDPAISRQQAVSHTQDITTSMKALAQHR